ncbi:MAG: 4-amino-4-deoxy-L-arabinose transferase [Thermodesulfobacteriota bacterium]
MVKYIPLILAGVLLNAFAQILLKKGMLSIGYFEFQFQNFVPIIKKVTSNLFILSGLTSYVVSVAIWLLVLARAEVSYAYPFLSVGYVVVTLAGYFIFQEDLSWMRGVAVAIIIVGVLLLSRS